MPALTRRHLLPLLVLICLGAGLADARERPREGTWFENDRLLVVLVPRTPEQMAAFYEARGFPPAALERIRQTCFMTVHIRNKTPEILWLELEHWSFSSGDGQPLERLDEAYWQSQWNDIDLPRASRSTFGWTQLPAIRDLHHDESVGGNVVFPGSGGSVNFQVLFHTGTERQGEPVRLGFGQVPCGGKGAQQ